MDYYCSFRTCRGNFTPCELHGPGSGPIFDLSFDPQCAKTLRSLYERYVYPRISRVDTHQEQQDQQGENDTSKPPLRQTKALVVPGVFAPTGRSPPCRAWEDDCINPLNDTGAAYDRFWADHALDLWCVRERERVYESSPRFYTSLVPKLPADDMDELQSQLMPTGFETETEQKWS